MTQIHSHRHVPATQPQPASANRAPTQRAHADNPAAIGAHGTGNHPPAGAYARGEFRLGARASRPVARAATSRTRNRRGAYSGLVEHGEDEPSSGSGSLSLHLQLGAGHGGSRDGGDDSRDGHRQRSASFALPAPAPHLKARLAAGEQLNDTGWARSALAAGGELGLAQAFAERLLDGTSNPVRSPDRASAESLVHHAILVMLRVLEGKPLSREVVRAVLNRLADTPASAGPKPPPWLVVQLKPIFHSLQRARTPAQWQAALARRRQSAQASLYRQPPGAHRVL